MATCATTTVELEPIELQSRPPLAKVSSHVQTERLGDGSERRSQGSRLAEAGGVEPDATPHVSAVEKWNEPKINKFRVGAAFWSLLLMGANDAAYGVSSPEDLRRNDVNNDRLSSHRYASTFGPSGYANASQLEKYYDLTYTVVSMVFVSPFVGYVLSAIINNWLHLKIGQRGIAMLCGVCHILAYVVIAAHPPYIALIFAFMFAGFANGLGDAAWNAWIGNLAKASELLGFMHACYGAGGVFSPLVATAMITRGDLPWYTFYYIMVSPHTLDESARDIDTFRSASPS